MEFTQAHCSKSAEINRQKFFKLAEEKRSSKNTDGDSRLLSGNYGRQRTMETLKANSCEPRILYLVNIFLKSGDKDVFRQIKA